MAWQLFWTFWPLDRVHVSHLHFMLDYNTLLVVLKERIMEMCSGHTDKFSCIKCYPEKGYKKMGGNQNNTKIYCKESTSKAWKLHNGVRKENCERLILRFLAWLIGGMTMIGRNGNMKKQRKIMWALSKWLSLTEPTKEC